MGEKRKHESAFQVGPANLPDGTRKRKADRIKQALIDRAKIKQDFAKVKKRKLQEEEDDADAMPRKSVYDDLEEDDMPAEPVSAVPHPDRQALMNEPQGQDDQDDGVHAQRRDRNRSRHGQNPYAKQLSKAQKQKEDADQRRQDREEKDRQRQEAIKHREKMQQMIRKAKRPTLDGKRKLGRESAFLLEKVKRMVNG